MLNIFIFGKKKKKKEICWVLIFKLGILFRKNKKRDVSSLIFEKLSFEEIKYDSDDKGIKKFIWK